MEVEAEVEALEEVGKNALLLLLNQVKRAQKTEQKMRMSLLFMCLKIKRHIKIEDWPNIS